MFLNKHDIFATAYCEWYLFVNFRYIQCCAVVLKSSILVTTPSNRVYMNMWGYFVNAVFLASLISKHKTLLAFQTFNLKISNDRYPKMTLCGYQLHIINFCCCWSFFWGGGGEEWSYYFRSYYLQLVAVRKEDETNNRQLRVFKNSETIMSDSELMKNVCNLN